METKIDITKKEELAAAINKVEKGCRARLLHPSTIDAAVENAEGILTALKIPKKYWDGSTIHLSPAKVPNSYKYTPEGTLATIIREKGKWCLVKVWRGRAGSTSYGGNDSANIMLSELAWANIPTKYKLW